MGTKNRDRQRSPIKLWLTIALVAVVIIYIFLGYGNQMKLEKTITEAQGQHGQDPVEALLLYAESDAHRPAERNQAVWALGELRNRTALPGLQKLLMKTMGETLPVLSEPELRKAIQKVKGEVSDPFWVLKKIFGN
jgi:hypothetical protein